ncbi:MAG: polysaccharide biosynthesis/export family protein [Candidatus Hydrogenedentes bacterium]|nr:polysaccharide biosynthesis/export family protein [Candidatus Hydrogenedentota bacterium]
MKHATGAHAIVFAMLALAFTAYADDIHNSSAIMDAREAAAPAEGAKAGAIMPGDLVFIDVFRRPEMSTTAPVDANGSVALPYVGTIAIGGLTEAEATERVTLALSGVLRNPRVTVSKGGPGFTGGYRTQEMKTELLPLQNANAEALCKSLSGMASDGGSVSYDDSTNTLIITDTPATIQNMLSVVARLDQMQSQLQQVRIEAKIAEVKVGAIKELGVRWFVQGDHANGGYYPMPSQDVGLNSLKGQAASPLNNEIINSNQGTNNGLSEITRRFIDEPNFDRRLNIPIQIAKTGQMFFGYMNSGIDLGLLIDALVADDNAELLANPNILTVNHRQAEIKMTDEFPYTEFGTEVSGRANFSTRFLDLGIKMVVTPHVYRDEQGKYVKLEFEPEVSFPSGSNNGVPIRSVRSYRGESNVRDGQTLVVGGIYRNDLRHVEQRVPGVGKLPVIGNLFKHNEKSRSQTELMVFLTPTVHDSPETVTWDRMLDVTAKSEIVGPAIGAPLAHNEARRD